MSSRDHHFPCPCGAELADECPRCNQVNPFGSMRFDPALAPARPLLTKVEQVAQIAWEWLLAGRHADDIATLIAKGHEALHFTPADAAAVRSEVLS